MVRFFGDITSSTAAQQIRRKSLRRGSEIGERLEHTIHLTSNSSAASALETGVEGGRLHL